MRITLNDVMLSRLPGIIGKCNDIPGVAKFVNQAQQQLINAGGETGWFGGWQRVVFQITACNPYLTLPRAFARIVNLAVCRQGIRLQNEFYELLEAGIGLQDFCKFPDWSGTLEGYERGVYPTLVDVATTNQLLQLVLTDPRDVGKRVLVGPCRDQNGNSIYTQDGNNSVNGFYLTLAQLPATSAMQVSYIGGIQKDATFGDVLLYSLDATTGAQVLLSRYAPDEIDPGYRRYYFNKLPCSCNTFQTPQSPCLNGATTPGVVQLTALCKLEFIPANRATDYLIIGNIPALIEECKAIRYADMDLPTAAQLEAKSHAKAIKYLNDELRHYLGELQPAVNLAPFGTATLRRARVGRIL